MNRTLRVPAILLLLAASCGRSSEAVVQEHRAAVEARLSSIRAIGDKLLSDVTPSGGPFELTGPPPSFGPWAAGPNAIVMDLDHFAFPDPPKPGFRLCDENPIADAASLMKSGEFHGGKPGNAETKGRLLRAFSGLRYVLVIRWMEVKEPVIIQSTPKTPKSAVPPALTPTDKFSGGTCLGDLVLYDIDQKKSVGGFRFHGENSNRLDVSSTDQMGYLLGDLKTNTLRSITAEFVRRYPTATPPFKSD